MGLYLCDHKIPIKLKEFFYEISVRPTMLYGNECWVLKKQHVHKISVVEIRIFRWISRNTRKHRIQNEEFA